MSVEDYCEGENFMNLTTNQINSTAGISNPYWSNSDISIDVCHQVNYVYINPDLVKLLKRKEKKVRVRKCFLDDYIYFCGTISYLGQVDKRFKGREYVGISHEVMTSIISEYKYIEIINNLKEWEVIECDDSYQVGYKSKGYKLLKPYDTNLKKIMIKDELINSKINKFKEIQLKKLHELPYPYQYLEMQNKRIKMDTATATRFNNYTFMNSTDLDVYDSNFIAITDYKNLKYRFKVDDNFGNRAHTNLTNLNSNLRYTLNVQGDKLGQVDIKNSQPLFFYTLIRDVSDIADKEKDNYKSLVESGKFYEYFMKEFNIPTDKRDKIKPMIITGLFADKNRSTENRYFNYFSQDYPNIAYYIKEIKNTDRGIEYNGTDYYKNLICLMQREESRFVIEKVVAEFINRYEGEFISTIHDSIVVKTQMLPEAEQLMMECGIQPQLKRSEFTREG